MKNSKVLSCVDKSCKDSLMLVIFFLFIMISGCAFLPMDFKRTPSYAIENSAETQLGVKAASIVPKYSGKSGFYALSEGIDAFVARIGVVKQAERSLDVQYYIWHTDTVGILLVDRLLQAADRNVRVRVLLDDLDTEGKDREIINLDAHPNIEIRIYNPFAHRGSRAVGFTTELKRLNRRMHNKSLTADNQATIVGGRNIGNEYFGATSHAEFADLDVLAIGPVVADVSTMFDSYWNSEWVFPIAAFADETTITEAALAETRMELDEKVKQAKESPYIEAISESGALERLQFENMEFFWGEAILVYDAPTKVTAEEVTAATHLAPKLIPFVDKITKELLIVSPYFVPGDELVKYFRQLVERGIQVRVLTNSLAANDVGVVHAGYMRYRKVLLKAGVELYEFKADLGPRQKVKNKKWTGSSRASLHAKTFALDRRALFVGSFNLDPRSVALNTEMGVLFESPELAGVLGKSFDEEILNKAYKLRLNTIPADEEDDFGAESSVLEWLSVENGNQVRYTVEPNTNWWQRFVARFLSIFVIESFL